MQSDTTIPLVPFLRALLDYLVAPLVAEDNERSRRIVERTDIRVREFKRENGHLPTDNEIRRIQSSVYDEVRWEQIHERNNDAFQSRETLWSTALSRLFSAMTVRPMGEPDPRIKEFALPDDMSPDESELRDFLQRVRHDLVAETSALSVELARLNAAGFGSRLAAELQQRFPEEMPSILEAARATNFRNMDPAHSFDFSAVRIGERHYTFTPIQRTVVKALWAEWERGTIWLSQATLQEEADTESRIVDLFKSHPTWGTLIVRHPTTKDLYGLSIP